MRRVTLSLAVLLITSSVLATIQIGRVVSADEKELTIQPEYGDKLTMTYDPDMGKKHNRFVPRGTPLGVTPDKIKAGMIVQVNYDNEKGTLVCKHALIIIERLGPREIDFAPMQAKDKGALPKFVLRVQLQSHAGLGNYRPYNRGITFKEGTSVKEVRDCLKGILSREEWKVKEVGDGKLLLEAFKDKAVYFAKVEAEGLPKEQQPAVRLIEPADSGKK
jgi:hypothetical protein